MGLCDLIILLAITAGAWALAYTIRFRLFHYEDLPSTRTVIVNLVIALAGVWRW